MSQNNARRCRASGSKKRGVERATRTRSLEKFQKKGGNWTSITVMKAATAAASSSSSQMEESCVALRLLAPGGLSSEIEGQTKEHLRTSLRRSGSTRRPSTGFMRRGGWRRYHESFLCVVPSPQNARSDVRARHRLRGVVWGRGTLASL